jgi:hypothetical protein
VTFIVSVASSLQGQSIPSGTVVLKDGSTVLATLTLRQGRAHYVTSSLAPGTHKITATYSGDTTFNPHHSPVLEQKVTQ